MKYHDATLIPVWQVSKTHVEFSSWPALNRFNHRHNAVYRDFVSSYVPITMAFNKYLSLQRSTQSQQPCCFSLSSSRRVPCSHPLLVHSNYTLFQLWLPTGSAYTQRKQILFLPEQSNEVATLHECELIRLTEQPSRPKIRFYLLRIRYLLSKQLQTW